MLLAGSCFSQNIALKMQESMWNAVSPLGVLYNPASIAKALSLAALPADNPARDAMVAESVLKCGRQFRSWLFDSKVADEDPGVMRRNISGILDAASEALVEGAVLIVTFGTSWVYSLASPPGYIVANCHKQPAAMFQRSRLSVEEIADLWKSLVCDLKRGYPGIDIVFTVSPVRHLKDGFSGNACSKATLLLAVEQICRDIPFCHYFPAYEIVTDDLRDYRFYASDLVHPSDEAVEYLWDIFKQTFMDDEGKRLLAEGNKLFRAINHRPLYCGTKGEVTLGEEAERQEQLLRQYRDLKAIWPGILPYPKTR